MARPLRIEYDGALYHVTSRGNERKAVFKSDGDRDLFLATLGRVAERFHWICHAYCLMNNHYHLVIETPDGNLSKGMRQLNGVYTQTFNRRHGRVGHLFQGRFKAIVVQKDSHFLEVCRYVVLNPVRAKSVGLAQQWKWSSYGATAGVTAAPPWLTTDEILGQFGQRRSWAQQKYREFVAAGVKAREIWKEVKGQTVLGLEGFAQAVMEHTRGTGDIREIPKGQRFLARPALERLFGGGGGIRARDKQIIAAIERHGYSQREIADHLALHYSTVSRIVKAGDQD